MKNCPMTTLRSFFRPIRLGAAMALVCALCLPLSRCSQGGNASPPPPSQTLMSELFPRSTKDVTYAYAFEVVGFTKLGICTLIAFTWPILSVVVGRKWMESRFSWIYHFVELALCAGTCYILTVLTFWAEWLYGGYVVAISIGLFACTALVFLCCSLWAICRKWWTKVRGSREQGRGIVDLAASG